MPGLSHVEVGLGEALEVQGGPLNEDHIWAVLAQAAEALQDLFLGGDEQISSGHPFGITTDSLLFGHDGHVKFLKCSFDTLPDSNYVPSEYRNGQRYTEDAIEKMLVFSLGMTMYSSADYKLQADQALSISDSLDSLLGAMCEEDPQLRSTLMHVIEACAEQRRCSPKLQQIGSANYVISLYKMVLGSQQQINPWLDDPDPERYIPRRRRKHSSSRHKSRSRSRSRSKSRERHGYPWPGYERPHPDGKAQSVDGGQDGYNHSRSAYLSPHRHMLPHSAAAAAVGRYHRPVLPPPQRGYDPHYPAPPPGPRRVMSQPDVYQPPPPPHMADPYYNSSIGDPYPQDIMLHDPHAQRTYQRLKERQRKLRMLQMDSELSDVMSTRSEFTDFGDRRSMISANSYTQGVYHPHLYPYGPETALRMGGRGGMRDSEPDRDWSGRDYPDLDPEWSRPEDEEVAWLTRQEQQVRSQQQKQERSRPNSRARSRQGRTPDPNARSPRSRTSTPSRKTKTPAQSPAPHSKKKQPTKNTAPKPNLVPRDHYGPEFLTSDIVTSVHVPQSRLASPQQQRHVIVLLLNGQKLDVTCDVNTLGKDVMEVVNTHVGLHEHYYFGLSYLHENEHFFLEGDTKLSKVAPSNWKDPGKGSLPAAFALYFRIKFYVENLDLIKHPVSQHLFYLQLRKDILEDRCQCSEDQGLLLASLALQAEYGDWHKKAKDFHPEHYVSLRLLRRLGRQAVKDLLPEQHVKHVGMGNREAQIAFIKEMFILPEYGLHFYKVFRSKKDRVDAIYTGIGVQGVLIADLQGDMRRVIHRHPWHNTQKISFNRRRFSITPKSDMGPIKLAKLNYYTDDYKKGRYLLQFSTAHHRFQMMMRMRSTQPDLSAMIEHEYPMEAGRQMNRQHDEESDDEEQIEDEEEQEEQQEYDEDLHNNSFEDYSDDGMPVVPRHRRVEQPYANLPSTTKSRKSHAAIEEWAGSTRPAVPGGYALSDSATDNANRKIVMVDLHKDSNGIGITIVGGENTGKLDLGIFVKSVDAGSPADLDGRVQPGDRIIAINGQSLEGIPHHKAVDMIRESPPIVQLLLSQPIGNGTHQTLDHDDSLSLNEVNMDELLSPPLPAAVPRPPSVNSTDLELEDVVPREALTPQYVHTHMTPVEFEKTKSPGRGGAVETQQEQDGYQSDEGDLETDPEDLAGLKPGQQYRIFLKKVNNSLGLNVTGGVNTSVKHGGIYVKSFAENGAAETDGRVHIGDRVLQVNGTSLVGVTHKQAVETLRSAPQVCELVMERGVPPPQRLNSRSSHDDHLPPNFYENQKEVTVVRQPSGLGLSMIGGRDTAPNPLHCLPRIGTLYPGGAAAMTGELEEGDVVLRVNGEDVIQATHEELLSTFRSSGDEVHLTVCRPPAGILPHVQLLRSSSEPAEYGDTDGEPESASTPISHLNDVPSEAGSLHSDEGVEDEEDMRRLTPMGIREINIGSMAQDMISNADTFIENQTPPIQSSVLESDVDSQRTHSRASSHRSSVRSRKTLTPEVSRHSPTYSQKTSSQGQRTPSEMSLNLNLQTASQSPSPEVTPRPKTPSPPSSARQKTPSPESSTKQPVSRRTPSPVSHFLHDAGLSMSSVENTPSVTPRTSLQHFEPHDQQHQLHPGEYEVSLTKGEKGLGFTVAGGQQTTGYFYVKEVLYDPAFSCGLIEPGDRLIEVDGQDMRGLNHREAVMHLRQTPSTVRLRFCRPPPSDSEDDEDAESNVSQERKRNEVEQKQFGALENQPIQNRAEKPTTVIGPSITRLTPASELESSFGDVTLPLSDGDEDDDEVEDVQEYGVIRITINKNEQNSLGFTFIQGEKGVSSALYVKNIVPDGPADEDGRLRQGDRILQVNGESMIGMAHNKALALLKQAPKSVSLTVSRGPSRPTSAKNKLQKFSVSKQELAEKLKAANEANFGSADSLEHYKQDEIENSDSDEEPHAGIRNVIGKFVVRRPDAEDSEEEDSWMQRRHTEDETEGDTEFEEELAPTYELSQPKHVPQKPPRRNPFARLPPVVSTEWLESLALVTAPADSVHYRGRQLAGALRQLRAALSHDEPVEEYKSLRHAKLTDNCNAARQADNKVKNRYRNVLPYDATRVCLSKPNDYINASHVRYQTEKTLQHYIACQGPMPNTIDDFWRMVWENKIQVIVMLTKDTEVGKVKCHTYWPNAVEDSFTTDRYEVSLVAVQQLPDFSLHHIKLEDMQTGESHRVAHLHFTAWPDHGTPTSGIPLLQYIHVMHLLHDSGPIVVHCSAGIGRTGAFITIDIVLELVARDLKFDIQRIVEELRRQRQGMIQTKDQYSFCYKTVLEALETLQGS